MKGMVHLRDKSSSSTPLLSFWGQGNVGAEPMIQASGTGWNNKLSLFQEGVSLIYPHPTQGW